LAFPLLQPAWLAGWLAGSLAPFPCPPTFCKLPNSKSSLLVGFSSHWRIGCCWVNSISLHQNLCLVLLSVICCQFCVFEVCFTTADVDSSHSGHVKK
jgi:hypothetical protein